MARPRSRALLNAGRRSPARIPMIPMTTRSSISVKPPRRVRKHGKLNTLLSSFKKFIIGTWQPQRPVSGSTLTEFIDRLWNAQTVYTSYHRQSVIQTERYSMAGRVPRGARVGGKQIFPRAFNQGELGKTATKE